MSDKKECACGTAPKLIFACSGASDVGGLADLAARKLNKEGAGKMYCLTGIGGRAPGIMATTQGAAKIVAIDGCALNCAKHTLEQACFSTFEHVGLVDLGLQKGQSPATDDNVNKVAQKALTLLACK